MPSDNLDPDATSQNGPDLDAETPGGRDVDDATAGGHLVLVFDDGYAEDYDRVRPVLLETNAVACFAVVPEWLGQPDHLAADQLADLEELGCEVVAHGRRHRRLQSVGLAGDAAAGDDRLRVSGEIYPAGDHCVYPGDEYEVTDGGATDVVTLAGKGQDDAGPYLDLEAPLSRAFAAGRTSVRPADATIEDEVVGVLDDFEAVGLRPRSFALPYDAADPRAWASVTRHYDALANAAVRSLPNPPGTPATNLRRYYLETDKMTRPALATYLDAVADLGGIGVLAGHSAWETVTPERVRWVVGAARERGVEVTTLERLLEDGIIG